MQTEVSNQGGRGAVCLLWFKRDLRVTDHPALQYAVHHSSRIVSVYIVEPEYWKLPDMSARHWQFTADCLAELRDDLAQLGAPLILRQGDAVACLDHLCRQFGIKQMVSHLETGNLWSFDRDRRVAAWSKANGVAWTELPQSAVTRGRARGDRWAHRRGRFVAEAVVAVPAMLINAEPVLSITPQMTPESVAATGPEILIPPLPVRSLSALPSAAQLGLAGDIAVPAQRGGRRQAVQVLEEFLHHRGQLYRRAMSSPLSAETACSRLSPYLAYGAITVREVVQITSQRQAALTGSRNGWLGSLASFQSRLAWRDHFTQKLEDQPDIESRCLHPAYEGLRPDVVDMALLKAWKTGETGVPFVDACMRFLTATGWLNFRMRAMLVSFASYQLWLDWRVTGQHLARLFTDYEPGIHWPQVQMQSGTTGINTIRIYNPVKQGLDQDPDGVFTRRWVPELNLVPDAFLQEPWRWDGRGDVLGRIYPRPVVDLKFAVGEARDRVWAVRKGQGFAAQANRIVTRHGSRKNSFGHFVNDRKQAEKGPRKPQKDKVDLRQMSLNL